MQQVYICFYDCDPLFPRPIQDIKIDIEKQETIRGIFLDIHLDSYPFTNLTLYFWFISPVN